MVRTIQKCLFYSFLLLVISLAPLATLTPKSASAQDDEQALLDRVIAALETAATYGSYQAAVDITNSVGWESSVPGVQMNRSGDRTVNQTYSFSTADGQTNLQLNGHFAVSQKLPDGSSTSYVLNSEFRMVDGTAYVQASYDEPSADLPPLPAGWIVADPDIYMTYPGLGVIDIGSIFNEFAPGAPFLNIDTDEMAATLHESLSSAESASETLDDGTTVERITVTLNPSSLKSPWLGGYDQDPTGQRILEAVTGEPVTLSVLVDESGYLVGLDLAMNFEVPSVDIGGTDPSIPEGFTISYRASNTISMQISAINEPVELASAPEIETPEPVAAPQEDLPWWNDRVFYEIFVRSFYDSDGDGIGDLRGVIEKLDYLNDGDPTTTTDLGITGIWLMPVAQSPSYHGYDVTDYYTIEEDYGTNEDFQELIQAAHDRGIAVIVDLVLNHTSSEHPWFIASEEGDPQFADWYIWSDDPPAYKGPWGQNVWHKQGDRYFFGLFWEGMPDLNYENPAVTGEMERVTRFWLEDMGVDGFRLDAVKHMIEDGPVMENTPATLDWLVNYRDFITSIKQDALVVGEVMSGSSVVAQYIGPRLDLAFEFDTAAAILNSVNSGTNTPILRATRQDAQLYPFGQYATFITNHDQPREMTQLNGDEAAAKVAATILLTSPGVPFIYYGEEIGMVGPKPDEQIRTPLQWAAGDGGGFTTGTPWEPLAAGSDDVNIASQDVDPASLLNHYRALVHLRNDHAALREGAMFLVVPGTKNVYSFLRFTEDETLLILVNLSDEAVTDYALTLSEGPLSGQPGAEIIFGEGEVAPPTLNAAGGFDDYKPLDTLPPQSSTIVQLK